MANNEDLEAFLDSALENDPVLRVILEEGMTQIIKAVFRLLNLQRGRGKGQSQGHSRSEKKLASKNVMNSGDREAPRVRGIPIAAGKEGSKDTGNNPPIGTLTSVGNLYKAEGEHPQDDHDPQSNPDVEIPPVDDDGGLPRSEIGQNLAAGIPKTPAQNKGPLKHCCYFCQKTFPTPSKLEAHFRTHTQEKPQPFPCTHTHCGKKSLRKMSLDRHIRYHKKDKEKTFPCNVCGKEFAHKGNLEDHIRYHEKEKAFKCPHQGCSSSFITRGELKKHSRVHSGEKPFKCNFCGKRFAHKWSLEYHIRHHVNEKPFKCLYKGCTSSFVTGIELKRHSRVHSGEKPFACLHPGCGKTFSQSGTLTRHSRTHSGEKPFACPFPGCGKAFSDKSHMTCHRKIHDRSAAP